MDLKNRVYGTTPTFDDVAQLVALIFANASLPSPYGIEVHRTTEGDTSTVILSIYDLSIALDTGELALKTLISKMCMEGLLKDGTQIYTSFKVAPTNEDLLHDMLGNTDLVPNAHTASVCAGIFKAAQQQIGESKRKKKWATLSTIQLAEEIGSTHSEVQKCFALLINEKVMSTDGKPGKILTPYTIKTSNLQRHFPKDAQADSSTQHMLDPDDQQSSYWHALTSSSVDLEKLVKSYYAYCQRVERRDVGRIEEIFSLFNECESSGRDVGGALQTYFDAPVDVLVDDKDEVDIADTDDHIQFDWEAWGKLEAAVRAGEIKADSPRLLSRIATGVHSPLTMRLRLAKHSLWACLDRCKWHDVLNHAETLFAEMKRGAPLVENALQRPGTGGDEWNEIPF
jgi:hypothetical protein